MTDTPTDPPADVPTYSPQALPSGPWRTYVPRVSVQALLVRGAFRWQPDPDDEASVVEFPTGGWVLDLGGQVGALLAGWVALDGAVSAAVSHDDMSQAFEQKET